MKTLLVILSLVAMSAFAEVSSPVIASAQIGYGIPGRSTSRVYVHADGLVETLNCPDTPHGCQVVSTSQLSPSELPVLTYNVQQAANGPEQKPDPRIHCNAIGQKTVTYYASTATGESVQVARVNAPCLHNYRNNAAEMLVGQLDKLLPASADSN